MFHCGIATPNRSLYRRGSTRTAFVRSLSGGDALNWEAAGAIGEIVGALGVVVTLVYLATQIRNNTTAVNAATFQSNTEGWLGWYLGVAGPEAPDAYAVAMIGRSDIDPVAFHRFYLLCRAQFLALENQYYQYRQGILDESAFLGYEPVTRSMVMAMPGIRAWWQLSREGYGPEFVAYVDRLMEETQPMAQKRAANPLELFDQWKAALENEGLRNARETDGASIR